MSSKTKIEQQLWAAMQLQSADAVELALFNAYQVCVNSEIVPALLSLLQENFHTRHEDIVGLLQKLKDPRAVDVLYEATLVDHAYLDYDEGFGLARKCTWALADIGTPEAYSKLRNLAESMNPLIAGYAIKRLVNWDRELGRKGMSEVQQ